MIYFFKLEFMKQDFSHSHVIEQVPPDYYQKGVKKNFLQKKWHTGKLNAVISEITVSPKKILDVGCASGWFLSQLQNEYKNAECYGVDIYDQGIAYGKKKYPKMKFTVSDAHKLPYSAGTFDLVVCTEVLEHVDDPVKVLTEIKRVLKKDGKAIIELDSGSILFSTVWFLWKLSKGGVWNHAHLHSFNVQKLERMLKKVGFKIDSKRRFNYGMAMIFSAIKKG